MSVKPYGTFVPVEPDLGQPWPQNTACPAGNLPGTPSIARRCHPPSFRGAAIMTPAARNRADRRSYVPSWRQWVVRLCGRFPCLLRCHPDRFPLAGPSLAGAITDRLPAACEVCAGTPGPGSWDLSPSRTPGGRRALAARRWTRLSTGDPGHRAGAPLAGPPGPAGARSQAALAGGSMPVAIGRLLMRIPPCAGSGTGCWLRLTTTMMPSSPVPRR